ncbi:tetratricopeptide repeat protein [Novosphingobium piscinae]|uniref:Tetratricopeptide repeat protein n=1 Tax=Novosphingobium piscinae TaxID=1507448 RepID=A0A7X1FW93_9SPHN|nr:tetratricopeptide repeat protein [Novosphingobium piscinae]
MSAFAVTGCSDGIEAANAQGAEAQALLDAGDLVSARKTITAAIAKRDDIVALHLLRARIEERAGSAAGAFSAYNAALALDSTNGEALAGVARLGMQLGYVRESESAANRILALDPRAPIGLLFKGLSNLLSHRFEAAVTNADAILEQSPNDENALILKSRALSLLGKSDEAFAVIEQARTSEQDPLGIVLTKLELHRYRGNGADMVPLLEQARRLAPDRAEYDVDEADTLYKLGKAAEARSIIVARLLDAKTDGKTAHGLTALWAEYDRQPLDAAAMERIARDAPLPARLAVARHFLEQADPVRAIATLANSPYINDVIALRARAMVAQGNLKDSMVQVDQILAKDRTHCDALLAKAAALARVGRFDGVVPLSNLAANTCPQQPVAYVLLAQANEALGNKAGSLIAFRDGFDRNGQDSALARTYSAWLERSGQSTRAVSIVRRLTHNAPSLLSGWKLYVELCTRYPAENCRADALAGQTAARTQFGVDPRTDEMPVTGLFGRLSRR